MQDLFLRYRPPGRHDGHGEHQRARAAKDLQAAASCRFPRTARRFASNCRRWCSARPKQKWQAIVEDVARAARRWPAGADRHAIDRQERTALERCSPSAASSTRCSTPSTSPRRPRSSPQPAQRGKVTVATNMAGRGTDIRLGHGVPELGGLHVICTELHESQRIDRQLIGRCGRQGDPGTYRQFLSLDDEILLVGLRPQEGASGSKQSASERPARCRAYESAVPQRPSARSNAATSATARCCSTTRKNGKKCSGRWAKTRIWIRRGKEWYNGRVAPISPRGAAHNACS